MEGRGRWQAESEVELNYNKDDHNSVRICPDKLETE
jgi:hypothetical protein